MLDFKPFQTVKISTVISYKYLKSLFFILISLFHRNKHMKHLVTGGKNLGADGRRAYSLKRSEIGRAHV